MASPTVASLIKLLDLSPMFAEQVVVRACSRAGLDAENLQPEQVPRLVGHLETALGIFCTPDEAKVRLSAIRRAFPNKGP